MAALNENSLTLLSTTTVTTNLSATGATTLFTVPTGKTCVLSQAWLKVGGDAGASLDVTIGQVGALTDFVGTTAGDNLDASNDIILIAPIPSAAPATNKVYVAGTVLQLNVAVAGNAVAGTVYLFGFLF